MAFTLVRSPEANLARAARIQGAKRQSAEAKNTVKLHVGDEKFVFERGALAEYEFKLPLELMDYPENTPSHYKEHTK
jgi:hypothetical protein